MVSDKTIRIMEEIFNNPENITEKDLNDKFGEKNYQDFSQFCLGGTTPFAINRSNNMFKLTQEGVRELHILIQQRNQKNLNKLTILITFILGLGTFGNILMNFVNTKWDTTSISIGFVLMFIIGLMTGILYLVFFELKKTWKN